MCTQLVCISQSTQCVSIRKEVGEFCMGKCKCLWAWYAIHT